MKEEKRCLNTYECYGKPTIELKYRVGNEERITTNFCSMECLKKYKGEIERNTITKPKTIRVYTKPERCLYLQFEPKITIDPNKITQILLNRVLEKLDNGWYKQFQRKCKQLDDGKNIYYQLTHPEIRHKYEYPRWFPFSYTGSIADRIDNKYGIKERRIKQYLVFETYNEMYNPDYRPSSIKSDVVNVNGKTIRRRSKK